VKPCRASVGFIPNALVVADDLDGLWAEIHIIRTLPPAR
jgi:hypothetical protein